MSWFSELTSKAEAMLVKLDKGTAEVLQNPDNILKGTKLLDSTLGALHSTLQDNQAASGSHRQEEIQTRLLDNVDHLMPAGLSDHGEIDSSRENDTSPAQIIEGSTHTVGAVLATSQDILLDITTNGQLGHAIENYRSEQEIESHDSLSTQVNHNLNGFNGRSSSPITSFPETPPQIKKFKLQTSKLRQTSLGSQMATNGPRSSTRANGHSKTRKDQGAEMASLGADDIRASINKSLREYSLSTPAYNRPQANADQQTTYTSHFDNQPNLIQSPESNTNYDRLSGRLQSSPSFSISFDENSSPSTDIAEQILRQSAMKKSAFNIHKVINKLAGNRSRTHTIIGDTTKIRLRRAQMRAASYLRRLNYYFIAYPTMKYWMIGYLVALQLLVIYVLFFYQSSGPSNYLTSQVKRQRQDLVEPLQSNSEKINSSPNDLLLNSFS